MLTMSSQWPKLKAATGNCEKWVTFESMFKAVVLLMVWGLLSFPVTVYFASKDQSTSSDWLGSVSILLQSLEGNCAFRDKSDYNATELNENRDCSSSDSVSQVGAFCEHCETMWMHIHLAIRI